MPPFASRPFAAVVDAFRELAPDIREQAPQHYDAATAFSAEDLGEWPSDPPCPPCT